MPLPRYAAKRDAVEREVVAALEQCGFSVERLDRPVDLLLGFRKRTFLAEVKSGNKGYGKSLNANQQEFTQRWRGTPVAVLRSAQDAIDFAVQVASEMEAR